MNPTTEQPELPAVPLERWLNAKELGAKFARKDQSVYRWRDEGVVPERFVKFAGPRNMLFHPAMVAYLEEVFEAGH